MIRRTGGYLALREGEVPAASTHLQREGWAILPGVFSGDEVKALAAEVEDVFASTPPDRPDDERDEFRHEMLNRSPLCQRALAHPSILETIEPLLGEDCHVIANTAWRNPTDFPGGPWHIDAGPHVPRPEGVPWDDRIPYPVFVIATHLLLMDCPLACGPTAVIPRSHRSGRYPPRERPMDESLTHDGVGAHKLEGNAGDVLMFASDVWHRGSPARGGNGRLFVQAHYARRDVQQRLRTTAEVNHLSPEAVARARTPRERSLVGLHDIFFYDA